MRKIFNENVSLAIAVLFIMGLTVLGLVVIYGSILSGISKSNCKTFCKDYEGFHYEIIKSGNMDTRDTCLCYVEEDGEARIKVWRMK